MPIGIKGFQKGHKINFGKKYSEERRKNISDALRGREFSPKWKEKLSCSHLGHKQSDVIKKKISNTMKGKSRSWLVGRKLSELHKINLSLAGNGHIVSKETRIKISESQKGKKGNNWHGGITKKNLKDRNGLSLKLWREAVFSRDNYTCQKYWLKNGSGIEIYLCAHHIQNFANYPELRFAIDNGITLSEKAHREFHKLYGMKNNTREQLEEFLSHKILL